MGYGKRKTYLDSCLAYLPMIRLRVPRIGLLNTRRQQICVFVDGFPPQGPCVERFPYSSAVDLSDDGVFSER
jgi:hypothetical protein